MIIDSWNEFYGAVRTAFFVAAELAAVFTADAGVVFSAGGERGGALVELGTVGGSVGDYANRDREGRILFGR